MVYFVPEIIEQGFGCCENVGNLFFAYMLMKGSLSQDILVATDHKLVLSLIPSEMIL
jgi:hypothetical protein